MEVKLRDLGVRKWRRVAEDRAECRQIVLAGSVAPRSITVKSFVNGLFYVSH